MYVMIVSIFFFKQELCNIDCGIQDRIIENIIIRIIHITELNVLCSVDNIT